MYTFLEKKGISKVRQDPESDNLGTWPENF